MKRSTLVLIFALTSSYAMASDKGALQSSSAEIALRAQGKSVFVTRCAKCHDEDGSKKLPDGTTLVERLARSQNPEARLQTRLKDPQELRAVTVYMKDILTRLHSASKVKSSSLATPR